MLTSPHEVLGRVGKGKERKTENKTRFPKMGNHSLASFGFPETNTALLLSDLPILKISYITGPSEEMGFLLSIQTTNTF